MASALALDRVREDVVGLARAGHGVRDFAAEFDQLIGRALPHVAACYAIVDPQSRMPGPAYKFGILTGRNEFDADFARLEYGPGDPTSFRAMAASGSVAISVMDRCRGDLVRSARMQQVVLPAIGARDELRLIATGLGKVWGTVALFSESAVYTDREVAFLASLSAPVALGLRRGLLAAIRAEPVARLPEPAVVLLDGAGRQIGWSRSLDHWQAAMASGPNSSGITGMIAGLATACANGGLDGLTEVRILAPLDGGCLAVVRGVALTPDSQPARVAVTLSVATPAEATPLMMDVAGLTPREREIVMLSLSGRDTRAIGAATGLSEYTVQDHFRSIFAKVGVHSRAQLAGQLVYGRCAEPALLGRAAQRRPPVGVVGARG